jgi:hypothetical protein
MTVGDQIADRPRCANAACVQLGLFGYRDKAGALIWYCAQHRLAQFWADARMSSPLTEQSEESSIDDNDHQHVNRATAESAGPSLANPLDVPLWDRPCATMDGQPVRRANRSLSRPKPVAPGSTDTHVPACSEPG